MAIEKAEVFVTSPGRNFVVFRITTTDGVVGLGDATLNGRELVAAKYLETIAPSLIGKNEDNIEDIWQYLYKGAYWKRGPVTMAAISAVDVALWDIKAKKAGVPVYELLGGASRTGILTYAHASGVDFPSLFDSIDMYRDMASRPPVSSSRCLAFRQPMVLPAQPMHSRAPARRVCATTMNLHVVHGACRGGLGCPHVPQHAAGSLRRGS